VGALGFVVDGGILTILTSGFGASPFWARVPSFTMAVVTTWLCHVFFTFRQMPKNPLANLVAYAGSSLVGTFINLGIYTLCLLAVPEWRATPVLPLALGAVAGLMFNYAAARLVLFARK